LGFGLWTLGFGLWALDFGLWTLGCEKMKKYLLKELERT